MRECWRDIPDFEGYYEASTLGRIRSVDRIVGCACNSVRAVKGHITPQHSHNTPIPYRAVNLHRQGNHYTALVHRLVAITWLGPVPPGYEVRHGENGFADNSVSNLCYGTRSDNEKDKIRDGTRCKRVKRSDGAEFDSILEAAEHSGCHASRITAVCKGSRKTTGGYGWTYC